MHIATLTCMHKLSSILFFAVLILFVSLCGSLFVFAHVVVDACTLSPFIVWHYGKSWCQPSVLYYSALTLLQQGHAYLWLGVSLGLVL